MRGNTELKEILRAASVAQSGTTRFSKEIPLGEGWYRMLLRFSNAVTIGTGTGAIADGVRGIIKGITLRSDRNEYFYNNVPGRAIKIWQTIFRGTVPPDDTVTASTATFKAEVELWFVDPLSLVPMDTILDTRRYSALTLEISYGGVADFYTTVGTSSNITTLDIYVERVRGALPPNVRPRAQCEFGVRAPVDPSTTTLVDLERAQNLGYKRILVFGSLSTATPAPAAGVPFSSVGSDSVYTDVTLDHDAGRPYDTCLYDVIQYGNKQLYTLESRITGCVVLDQMVDGSHQSMLYSGNKSRLRVQETTAGGVAAGSQTSIAYQGVRPLIL
jgi:hypothetical protein